MNNHTPGPWTIDRRRNGLVSLIKFAGTAEFTAGTPARCEAEDDNAAAIRVNDANARLIAAAPELLAALQSAVASLEQLVKINRIPANNKGLRDARDALAKAGI
jgi:hypothetical protein